MITSILVSFIVHVCCLYSLDPVGSHPILTLSLEPPARMKYKRFKTLLIDYISDGKNNWGYLQCSSIFFYCLLFGMLTFYCSSWT